MLWFPQGSYLVKPCLSPYPIVWLLDDDSLFLALNLCFHSASKRGVNKNIVSQNLPQCTWNGTTKTGNHNKSKQENYYCYRLDPAKKEMSTSQATLVRPSGRLQLPKRWRRPRPMLRKFPRWFWWCFNGFVLKKGWNQEETCSRMENRLKCPLWQVFCLEAYPSIVRYLDLPRAQGGLRHVRSRQKSLLSGPVAGKRFYH